MNQIERGHVIGRLLDAQNRHDIDGFVACFAPDYRSEQPLHPNRAFVGSDQVRKNWSAVFAGVPDFRAELVRSSLDGEVAWTEWEWRGTRADGPLHERGVVIFGIRDDLVAWARLYLEDVEADGEAIDAEVRRMSGRK
jgi:hypothetical protein